MTFELGKCNTHSSLLFDFTTFKTDSNSFINYITSNFCSNKIFLKNGEIVLKNKKIVKIPLQY